MNVLISGAGIAGSCLAYWLERHAFSPTIVERATEPRAGGYIIDFWGAGFDVADRMGLVPEITARGYKVAAFTVEGYRPRDELTYVIHRQVGQQVGRFSMRGDRTLFLFVFRDGNTDIPADLDGQKALLRRKFAASGWECSAILEALDRQQGFYIDRVSQIQMDRWNRGRVALVGDAACCVSFLAGQGSALAMVAAYVLAGELKRANGDYQAAFGRYEKRLRELIATKQDAARKFASFFAPRSRFAMLLGNEIMKLMALPWLAELAVGRELMDSVELPEY